MNILVRPGLVNRTFEASDQDTNNASYYYFGFQTQDSNWVIQRFDNTVTNVISYRYACVGNNSTYTSYSGGGGAWANRATLTYDYFNVAGI